MVKAVADEADELTGELMGVADHMAAGHLLGSRRIDPPGLHARRRGHFFQVGRFEVAQQDREQIVGEGDEMRLGVGRRPAVGPGLPLVQFVFEHVVGFFDFPPQRIEQSDQPWGGRNTSGL